VPITISNNENTATPVNFQQLIYIPSNTYSQYINRGWSNVEFTANEPAVSIGNTILDAWVESNAFNTSYSTPVWVNLGQYTIGAAGSGSNTLTIYMNFMQSNVMNSNCVAGTNPSTNPATCVTGIAPQEYLGGPLSDCGESCMQTSYAEYDNGNSVFSFYDNFAGTSLNSAKWSVVNNTVAGSINNGFTVDITGTAGYYIIYSLSTFNPSVIAETLFSTDTFTPYLRTYDPTFSSSNTEVNPAADSSSANVIDWSINSAGSAYWNAQQGNSISYFTSSTGNSFAASNWILGIGYTGSTNDWYGFNTISNGNNQLNYGIYTSSSTDSPTGPLYLGLGADFQSTISITETYTWARTRAYPPNDIMPSTSFGNLGSSITKISCSPTSFTVSGTSTCTATVTGSSPTGTITWSQSGSGEVLFSSSTCTLSSGSCSVNVTGHSLGNVTIEGTYGGDSNNGASSGIETVIVAVASSTSVSCSPSTFYTGLTSTCTATVTGSSPTGTITWSQSGTGSVSFSSSTCTLSSGSCSVTATGSGAGSVTIKGTYGGDNSNTGSFGTNVVEIQTPVQITLASGQNEPSALTIYNGNVFWTDFGSGNVMEVSANGGTPNVISSGNNDPWGITIGNGNIYWIDYGGGTLNEMPINGGATTTIASGLSYPTMVTVDSYNAYVIIAPPCVPCDSIEAVSLSTGSITTLASSLGPEDLALYNGNIFWSDSTSISSNLNYVPVIGGTITTLYSSGSVFGIAVANGSVYWTESVGGLVQKVSISGGSNTLLASGQDEPWGIALGTKNIYWVDGGNPTQNSINEMPISGGQITTIANGISEANAGITSPQDIAIDSNNIYWINSANGDIMKIAK
jgi:hypothetical protein